MFDPDSLARDIRTCLWIVAALLAAISIASLINGCGQQLPDTTYRPSRADRQVFTEVIDRWREAELPGDPMSPACVELQQHLRIIVAEGEDFTRLCPGRCEPGNCPGYRVSEGCRYGCAAECFTTPCVGSWPGCWGTGNVFLGGTEMPLVTIHASRTSSDGYPEPALVRHGYIHFLLACTGNPDPGHSRREVWQTLDR